MPNAIFLVIFFGQLSFWCVVKKWKDWLMKLLFSSNMHTWLVVCVQTVLPSLGLDFRLCITVRLVGKWTARYLSARLIIRDWSIWWTIRSTRELEVHCRFSTDSPWRVVPGQWSANSRCCIIAMLVCYVEDPCPFPWCIYLYTLIICQYFKFIRRTDRIIRRCFPVFHTIVSYWIKTKDSLVTAVAIPIEVMNLLGMSTAYQ